MFCFVTLPVEQRGGVYNPYIRYTGLAKIRLKWQKLEHTKMTRRRRTRIKFNESKKDCPDDKGWINLVDHGFNHHHSRLVTKNRRCLVANMVGCLFWKNRRDSIIYHYVPASPVPIIVDFNSNPRVLSGPGKIPGTVEAHQSPRWLFRSTPIIDNETQVSSAQ